MIVAAFLLLAGCEVCHPQIARAWSETGMARSFSTAELVPPLETFYHQPSDRYYRIVHREGKCYLRRHQIGYRGAETNVVERSIDYAVGSGSHARSYVHKAADGRLIELPLGWYSEEGGHWAMSPGFDRPDHLDFRRPVSDECLFCHTGSGASTTIGCQRCHGPANAHQVSPSPANIVNPARLTPERQLEVCMQCHLQTTSRFLPHALRRFDRPVFSYHPAEPLAGYMLHFDHAPGTGYEEKFEVNSSAYRLRQSRCYLESRGLLTCTTCHDPHHKVQPETRYTEACRSCHLAAHSPETSRCVGCHMPRRRTEDAVHVVITDHRIQRRPLPGLLKPLAESKTVYQGEVVSYYPRRADELYLALAQVMDGSNLRVGVGRLEQAIARLRLERAEFYFELADAYRKVGKYTKAIEFYRQAAKRQPDLAKAYDRLGDVMLRAGDLPGACAVLQEVLQINAKDAEALNTLAVAYGQQGKIDASIQLLKRSVESNPDLPLAWLNLGVSLEQKGDLDAAEAAYREAIRVQPDFDRAHSHLANLLEARGDLDQARYERALAVVRKR